MRPACHLDTQNTVFWQFGHPKVYVRICWWWHFLEDRRCRSCSVTFIRHTKQLLDQKSKICKYIGFILLVVCTLYRTLDTQKSMKHLFGHPVSNYWLRPCWRGSLVSQRMAGDICTAYNGERLLSSVFQRADGAQRLLCERSVASLAIVLGNHCGWNGPITEQWWEPTVISCPQPLHHPAASSCCIHKLSLSSCRQMWMSNISYLSCFCLI